jgi:type I restriction enzyme S subunit
LIKIRKQQLFELDNLIKSFFYELFGLQEKCDEKPLIDIIVEGAGLSYGIVQPGEDVGTGVGIIRPIDIKDGEISYDDIKRVPPHIEEPYKRTRLSGNEILITVRGSTGDTALTDERCQGMNVTRGIAVIRQNDEIVNRVYLNQYLRSEQSQKYIQQNTKGATLKQLNLSALKKMLIPLPPLELQNKFADIVAKIEEQKALVKKAVDETQLLFDSLMSQYFDGS